MKKKILLAVMIITISIIAFGAVNVSAETDGIFTYKISNNEVTITDCKTSASGDIVIPDTLGGYPVTSLGNSAFYECFSIKTIKIPDSVISIGSSTFAYCRNLISITIPKGVKSIGNYAFNYCRNLNRVDISDISAWCKVDFGNVASSPMYYGGDLYLNGNLIVNLVIPNDVTSIGGLAFYNCSSIVSATIPESVRMIYPYAFYGNDSLSDVYYNGKSEDWSNITIGTLNESIENAIIHFVPNTRTTLSNNDKSFTVTPINIENGKTVILALYNGEQFVETQSAVYAGEAIPFTTTKAYTKAKVMVWNDLTSLKPLCSVENVKTSTPNIGNGGGDSSETEEQEDEILIYSLLDDGTYGVMAGADVATQASITIPETYNGISVTKILGNGFKNLTTLQSVILPDTVTIIGEDAFKGCTGLESVSLSNTLQTIGQSAFSGCTLLTEITIPSSVTRIESYAFYNAGLTNTSIENWNMWSLENEITVDAKGGNVIPLDSVNFSSKKYINTTDYYSTDNILIDENSTANALTGTFKLTIYKTVKKIWYDEYTYEHSEYVKTVYSTKEINFYTENWIKK